MTVQVGPEDEPVALFDADGEVTDVAPRGVVQ